MIGMATGILIVIGLVALIGLIIFISIIHDKDWKYRDEQEEMKLRRSAKHLALTLTTCIILILSLWTYCYGVCGIEKTRQQCKDSSSE